MTPDEAATAVLARLDAIPELTVLDGRVDTTPVGAYAVLYDNTPVLTARSPAGIANRLRWTALVVCVGRDPAECRDVVRRVVDQLADWPLPDGTARPARLRLVPTGAPLLTDDSVPRDVRHSQTLTFRLHTLRS